MKKLINGLRRIGIMFGAFFMSMYTKVMAASLLTRPQILYGVPEQDLYGVPRTDTIPMIWKIARGFIIPIAFVIGVIIYFKKSSSSVRRKILMTLISLVILVLLVMGINYILTNMQ